ncbi:hypothetical protein [Streptomyces sp. NBC_00878]|nr:hypothetical protein [Streptomyces sp. NBC_00878]MCX4906997.1 hypothetical protein [Streptomyces sp. NBC_00878]
MIRVTQHAAAARAVPTHAQRAVQGPVHLVVDLPHPASESRR